MKYSVKDIGILTAYSGLMLSRNQVLTTLLLIASGAAVVILAFVFGLSSIKKLFKLRRNTDTNYSFIPMLAIPVVWCCLPAIKIAGVNVPPAVLTATAVAMLVGFAAASIPLMFNLDAHNMRLNDTTLWVGYWTLCVGMLASGVSAGVFALQNAGTHHSFPIDSIRIPAVCGMVGSVFAARYLLAQTNSGNYGEPSR